MPDDVFRIIITVGVLVAAIAFIVQAFAAVAVYRAVRKMQAKVEPLADRAQPILQRFSSTLDSAAPLVDKASPVIDALGATVKKVGPVLDKAGPAVDQAHKLLIHVDQIIEESRPRITEITQEAVGIAHEGREQVHKIGELVADAGDRARTRLEQIDRTVESTVDQVEHVGDSVKKAVMRPVREVNGIAAGISAVVSTLVRGPRKSSVDAATQDEEMFI